MTAPLSKGNDYDAVEWRISASPVPYETAVNAMESRVDAILAGEASDMIWLLEHPPLYTAGSSARDDEILKPGRFPVFRTGRGGRMTYHGPGQRVVYVMTDLRKRGKDVRAHVGRLEEWIIRVLADFGLKGARRQGRVGIWVERENGRDEKIAALGVRVRRWVAYHGLSLNVCPDLEHFSGIVPCGLADYGVTSLHALGIQASMADVDRAFRLQANALQGDNK
jgi:lipoyl(octanoyl) transferase